MEESIAPGTRRTIDGEARVYYEGYWIKAYAVPKDTLAQKKLLIEALTRRLFNHTEHGLNIPGARLEEARQAYEAEADPAMKRVKGAMYAGANVNRATDIFRRLVELQELGVEIKSSSELMRECGRCLQEAYSLCRMVLHRSGEESIDELWGEPFRAFSIPLEEFYETRYVKIALAMGNIDQIAHAMVNAFSRISMFGGTGPAILELAEAAKAKCETLRTDGDIFDTWARFACAAERLVGLLPALGANPSDSELRTADCGRKLLWNGRDLIFHVTRARVPMPKSTAEYVGRCQQFVANGYTEVQWIPLPA